MRYAALAIVICLLVLAAVPASAASKWGSARLDAPVWESITVGATDMTFQWGDVYTDPPTNSVLAPKYSLEVSALVTYTPAAGGGPVSVEVELSYGTTVSEFTVTKADLRAQVLAALGLTEADVTGDITLEGTAKVKALNPGKGKGPQNNPFSNAEAASFTVDLPAPTP